MPYKFLDCGFLWVFFFETEFIWTALTVLKLAQCIRLSLTSQRSSCFCLPRPGIKGCATTVQFGFFSFFFFLGNKDKEKIFMDAYYRLVVVWRGNVPHRLMLLDTWYPVGGTVCGVYKTFRRWSLGRKYITREDLRGHSHTSLPIHSLCFMFMVEDVSSQPSAPDNCLHTSPWWTPLPLLQGKINPCFHNPLLIMVLHHSMGPT